jgi:hypothetical protein
MRTNHIVGRGCKVAPRVHKTPITSLISDVDRKIENDKAAKASAARYRDSMIAKGLITPTIPTDRQFAESYARNYVAAA